MQSDLEPKLAPPGAGLPTPELYLGRMLFAFRRLTGNRESFNRRFCEERATIAGLVRCCDEISGAKRVLIARARGMEDSSRYWSVWMTLDHLRIVHKSFVRILGQLAKEIAPEGQASTATVKPSPQVTAAVLPQYEQSCDELLATAAAIPDLRTRARYTHPWFGALDAAGWHALAAGHLGIHRVQIERILMGLKGSER